jgi:hypothetical protein
MLTAYAALIGAAVSAVAIILSGVSLTLHWLERNSTPQVDHLNARIDSLQTSQLDILDKVEHWQRRDRVRRVRESQESSTTQNEQPEPLQSPPAVSSKDQLRLIARQKGFRV